MSLIAELKRRNVMRVAIAYGIVGWLLAQIADLLFGTFGAPDWVLQAFVVVLFLGFPVALLLAWAFELTPDGIKRESSATAGEPVTRQPGRKLDVFIIGVLAIAVVFLLVDRFFLAGHSTVHSRAAVRKPQCQRGGRVLRRRRAR